MRTIILLLFAGVFSLSSFAEEGNSDFLYLNAEQLESLGLHLNKKGLFYKNLNPNWNNKDGNYDGLMFYCTKKNYLSTTHFKNEELQDLTYQIKILKNTKMTEYDFYPVLIGSPEGKMSMDNENINSEEQLLPIAIKLSDVVKNRDDILVVWFRPSESLEKALPNTIVMKDYLKTRLN